MPPTFRLTLSIGLASLLPASGASSIHSPAEQQRSFNIAPGYKVNCYASEELGIENPIQVRFDGKGRAWVNCSWTYPQIRPGQEADDKILVLEDVDRDGVADQSTVFADGLFMPLGIALGNGGVYVAEATKLLHLSDTDGDGHADRRRVVLRGFGTGDAHQIINSFRWGPGGELMFGQGLHAFSRVETPWGIERLHRAGVWRFRPRRRRLESFLGRGLAPHNPWGFVFSKWGQPFVVAGNGHGFFYLLPGMVSTDEYIPFEPIWDKGDKFGGAARIDTRHFPQSDQGVIVTGGYLNNAVYRFRLSDNGAGFDAKALPPLIRSDNTAFRVVDVKAGPDGALYLVDWCNPIIGHYQASFRHPERDKTHGRIWRVTAKDRPLIQPNSLTSMATTELVEHLKSPEGWIRRQAKRILMGRDTKSVTHALDTALQNKEQGRFDAHFLYETLGVYQAHEVIAHDLLRRVLHSDKPQARAYATRVIGHWSNRLDEPLNLIRQQIQDPHPRVRLEAVVACSAIPRAESIQVALMAVDRPMDRFIRDALTRTVHATRSLWAKPFKQGKLKLDAHPSRLDFLVRADGTTSTLTALKARLRAPEVDLTTKLALAKTFARTAPPKDWPLLLRREPFTHGETYFPDSHAEGLKHLAKIAKSHPPPPNDNLPRLIQPLLRAEHPTLRGQALALIGAWELKGFTEEVKTLVQADGLDPTVREAAIQTLGRLDRTQSVELLTRLVQDSDRWDTRLAALEALTEIDASLGASQGAALLAEPISRDKVPTLMTIFLNREEGVKALTSALNGRSLPDPIIKATLQAMRSKGQTDNALADWLQGQTTSQRAGRQWQIDKLIEAVPRQGNAQQGKEIFLRPELGCLACHQVNGQGGTIGPDLSAVGTGLSLRLLTRAVLQPDREVKEGYMAYRVVTKDGRVLQGYKVHETDDTLILKELGQSRHMRTPKAQIKSITEIGSVMPKNLTASLSRSELIDFLRYLSLLGRPGHESLSELTPTPSRFE